MPHPHLEHIGEHLERVRHGHLVDPTADSPYLGAEEEDLFWELVGLRLTGCPMVVLALLRFQNLGLPGIPNSRESLASHLSNLPTPRGAEEMGVLSAILPPHDQRVPLFLRRLRAGLRVAVVSLDPAQIEVAFDFRLQNPTLVRDLRETAPPLWDHHYRTVDGHVLRGKSHQIPASTPADTHRFVAISSPEQVTPQGTHRLPTLFVNRSYLALRARSATPEEAASLMNWVPFTADVANAASLLPVPRKRGAAGVRSESGARP